MAGTGGGSTGLRVGASASGSGSGLNVSELKGAMNKGIEAIKMAKAEAKARARAQSSDAYSLQQELQRNMIAAGMEEGRTSEICSKFAHDLIGACYSAGDTTNHLRKVFKVHASIPAGVLSVSSGKHDILTVENGVLSVYPGRILRDAEAARGPSVRHACGRPHHTFLVGFKITYKGGSDIHRMDALAGALKTGRLHYGGGGQYSTEATDLNVSDARLFKMVFRVPQTFTIPETTPEHVHNLTAYASPHDLLGISKDGEGNYLLQVRGGHIVNPMLRKLLDAARTNVADPNHEVAVGVVRAAESSAATGATIRVSKEVGDLMWAACDHVQAHVADRMKHGVAQIPRAFSADNVDQSYQIGTVDGMLGAPGTNLVVCALFARYAPGGVSSKRANRAPPRPAFDSDPDSSSGSGSDSDSGTSSSSSSDSGGAV
jgi:hypothetical protein